MTKSTHGIKKRQQVPNIHVKEAAQQYEEASQVLYRGLNPGSGILLPFLNTTVMGIELYLKTLSASTVYRPTPWDQGMSTIHAQPDRPVHKLSELIDPIPAHVRRKLLAAFKNWPGSEGMTLAARCKRYDKLFMASRYPFDPDLDVSGINIGMLRDLLAFAKQFVEGYPQEEWVEFEAPQNLTDKSGRAGQSKMTRHRSGRRTKV